MYASHQAGGCNLGYLCRGHEIEQHLSIIENHDHVTHYAILDDDSDMLPYQLPHFAKCDTYDGLGFSGYEKARRILGGEK